MSFASLGLPTGTNTIPSTPSARRMSQYWVSFSGELSESQIRVERPCSKATEATPRARREKKGLEISGRRMATTPVFFLRRIRAALAGV